MIVCNSICKKYGKKIAIKDLNLHINKGEFFVLLGPSGSGKSTLLNIIAGLINPTEGELFLNNINAQMLLPSEREIGFVFQDFALYEKMSIFDNLSFGLKIKGVSKHDILSRVESVSNVLGLYDKLKRKPNTLSGGEQQRVAIGRALIRDQAILLMDEPLAHLDVRFRDEIIQLIQDLHFERKMTVIYVTHDQHQAMILADRIGVMNEGVIQQIGTQHELYYDPSNLFVAGFIGTPKINKLKCTIDGEASFICFRPEVGKVGHIDRDNYLKIEVSFDKQLDFGDVRYIRFKFGSDNILIKWNASDYCKHETCISIPLLDALFFTADGERIRKPISHIELNKQ